MPSTTPSPLFTWIVGAFGVVCIVTILIATKGSGFRTLWQLVKTDLLIRNFCIAWFVILLVQFINVLFSNSWRGSIVLFCTLLNIVMLILIGYILPGRLRDEMRASMMEASTSKQKPPLDQFPTITQPGGYPKIQEKE